MLSRIKEIFTRFKGGFKVKKKEEFFNRIKNVTNPEVEKAINEGNPYTICDLLETTKGGTNGIYLKELEDAIIKTKDIVQIYEFMFLAVDMNITGFDRDRFEGIIRESKNPKLMCYCMEFVPGTNIKDMLEALQQTRNVKYMEMLISNEEYSDVLEEVKKINPNYEEDVAEAKKCDYYPESLRAFVDLKEDIIELKNKVVSTKNPHLITELANYIEYLNEYKGKAYDIEDLVIAQEETKDPMQAYEFLASVNMKNKSGLIQSVINSNRVKFMYYVYAYVPGLTEQEKEELQNSIFQKDLNGKYKRMFENETNLDSNGNEYK